MNHTSPIPARPLPLGRAPGSWALALKRAAAVLLCCLLAACGQEGLESGLAARVNGAPITLRDLEFAHDLGHYGAELGSDHTGTMLRREYGVVLAGLVVQELIAQELAKRGLEIGEAELLKAELAVRSSYVGSTFEDTLSEEGLDLGLWRQRIKAKLARETFTTRVLRPSVSVSAQEVQEYFKEHAREFAQPAMVKFIKVEAKNRDPLLSALEAARTAASPADLLMVFDDVTMQTMASPEEKLPEAWRKTLSGLGPGQVSRVVQTGAGFQGFLVLERSAARAEGAVQAYPLVEKRLVEMKLEESFAYWLSETLAKAVVEVNPGLLPEKAGQ